VGTRGDEINFKKRKTETILVHLNIAQTRLSLSRSRKRGSFMPAAGFIPRNIDNILPGE